MSAADACSGLLVWLILVATIWIPAAIWRTIRWKLSHSVVLSARIFIVNAAGSLRFAHCCAGVDSIIVSQIVEPDVLGRVETSVTDGLHDAVSAAVYRVVLELREIFESILASTGKFRAMRHILVIFRRLGYGN